MKEPLSCIPLRANSPHTTRLFMDIHLHHIPSLFKHIPLREARILLDAHEELSANNIKAERRLHEFIYGRYYLKKALATHLNQPAHSLSLLKHEHGKLYLANNPTFFNLTHSGEYLAFAICDDGEVGIDIEHPQKPSANLLEIAERYFAQAEFNVLNLCPVHQQKALFYKIWTLKEAALKAVGKGISAGLYRINTASINLHQAHTLALENSQHHLWFNYWESPSGIEDVYLSAALEYSANFNIHKQPKFTLHTPWIKPN